MIRGILIAILGLGIVGTAFWGYQEHREKNAILLNAENNYQRAFHDLTYEIDLLHDQIGSTLAMNSRQSLSSSLVEVWRLTSQAHSDVGQLPLTLLPFNKTEEFLSNIGDFSYRTAVRDLEKEPLNEEEHITLTDLYSQAADIQNELRNVQHLVLKNNLRWMDVEMALASGNETIDNKIIDGLKLVEKTVEGYEESNFGPTHVNMEREKSNFEHLKGRVITEDEAVEIAKKYANMDGKVKVNSTENGDGASYGFYSVSLQEKGKEASMDITKKGGYPIWYIMSRDVNKSNIGLNEAANIAFQFLRDNQFADLQMFESAQYDNIGVFTYVSLLDDVRIYPDSIKMKVALDNGEIIGFEAENYLKAHHERELPDPMLSLEEARAKVNPALQVMEDRLAVIVNDINEEVLCYEFLGTLGNDTYRIFVNAMDGREEKVEKLKQAEPLFEDVV
ncbi:germination protein YpeB [Bacillaceae bacterium Marseille-Q3522]|nr:germination protein YpeB [Bacillaceae bacterium Marseille-Q3522]